MSTTSNENVSTSDQPTLGLPTSAEVPATATGQPFGDYVLLNELGRGGMGVVFKAFEPNLGRHVALKMILSGVLTEAEDLKRFHSEASAAARLHHANIVKVHRVGVYEGRHFYAMDFIDGPTLAHRLGNGPLGGRTAARYLVTIAGAIQHAHAEGILHRDLKPSNILLSADDQPHVTDFGLAKQLSADHGQTRTGTLLGTPGYMAPEQATGLRDLTPATDVYGLGALLYELLTARPPFRGESTFETVLQVLEQNPTPPRMLNPRVDRDLETICLKCLAKDPRDRYPSAGALADDLQRYLNGESIEARSLNLLDYLGRTLERSQFDVEFRRYGNVILVFAGIVAVMHVIKHYAIVAHVNQMIIGALHILQFVLMLLVLWRYRQKGLLPTSTAERLLSSVWVSYVIACLVTGAVAQGLFGPEMAYEGKLYPFFCILTGMAFFIVGSSYWGMCYIISLLFFIASGVLLLDPRWGTLAFGALWTLSLLAIGLRLRHLGQDRGEG